MDEIEYNKEFNKKLTSGIVTKELLNDLDYAYGYGAATSISWLISKLKILKDIINKDSEIKIINDNEVLILRNQKEFYNWVQDRFKELTVENI